ncbi:transcriptional regulator [Lactobacillus huangpiensis]|uniref:transcriptional regulator n=1 Tax=Lactobacillus huangpiensis TaxID=2799571 RepID=UPI001CC513ED|nr:transcriptional regulator [Lactobacillus huangpiensis]
MAQTKKVMRSVTIRVPKDLYEDYKRVLHKGSRIVTYDLRNHMQKVVDEDLEKK